MLQNTGSCFVHGFSLELVQSKLHQKAQRVDASSSALAVLLHYLFTLHLDYIRIRVLSTFMLDEGFHSFIAWNSLKAKGCFSVLTNTHIYTPNRFHDMT